MVMSARPAADPSRPALSLPVASSARLSAVSNGDSCSGSGIETARVAGLYVPSRPKPPRTCAQQALVRWSGVCI